MIVTGVKTVFTFAQNRRTRNRSITKRMSDHCEKTALLSNEPHRSNQRNVLVNNENLSSSSDSLHGYSIVGLVAVLQAVRATCMHSILILTPIPPAMSLLTQAVGLFSLPLLNIYMAKLTPWNISKKSFVLLRVRAIVSGMVITFNLFTLQNLPVGSALTLFSTSPALASILSLIFLGYKISFLKVLFIIVNMFGVSLVSSPSFDVSENSIFSSVGILFGLSTAFLMASSLTLAKAMGRNVHHTLNVMSTGIGCFLCVPFLISLSEILSFAAHYPIMVICLLGLSTINFLAQSLLMYSMQFCRPGAALVVRSLNVPLSFLFGFVFLREKATVLEVCGVFLVLISVAYIGSCNRNEERRRS